MKRSNIVCVPTHIKEDIWEKLNGEIPEYQGHIRFVPANLKAEILENLGGKLPTQK